MSFTGEEVLALVDESRHPRVSALMDAIRAYEVAEIALRERLRHALDVGRAELEALRFVLRQEKRGEPVRVMDLARKLGCTAAAATSLVNRLERAGHLERSRDASDGRTRLVRLSIDTRARIVALLGPAGTLLDDALRRLDHHAMQLAEYVRDAASAIEQGAR